MKTLRFMGMTLLVCVCASFIACSSDDDDTSGKTVTVNASGNKNILTDNQFDFMLTSHTDAEVTGYKGTTAEIEIPANIVWNGNTYKVSRIGNKAFSNSTVITSVIVPDGITSFGTYAFSECSNLKYINIPEGVTNIDMRSFSGCKSLESITIPSSTTIIDDEAFEGCTNLQTVTIPDNGVTEIGEKAFLNCSSLKSIVIPKTITSIREFAFYNCDNLADMYIKPTTPPEISIIGCKKATVLHIPAGCMDTYKNNSQWSPYKDSFVEN